MTPTPTELYRSPDHYLHSFDSDDAMFVPMDPAAYRRSIFLDNRIDPAAPGAIRVPAAALGADHGAALSTAWIFHVAHCGSTLLARGLAELSANLVLREPFALRQLALSPDEERLAMVLRMLGKRYPGAGATVVKANVPVNFILPEIAAADPAARAIFLYYGWRDYLLAILRSDNHRAWLRNVAGVLGSHLGDLTGLSDAELAAALWLAQARRFVAALAIMSQARSLDAETFFADPGTTVLAAARHLGIATQADAVAALVDGPLFATYSKNPGRAFDNSARVERKAALEHALAGDIARAEAWLERNALDAGNLAGTLAKAALAP